MGRDALKPGNGARARDGARGRFAVIAWLITHLLTAARGVSARVSSPYTPLIRPRGCRAAGRVRQRGVRKRSLAMKLRARVRRIALRRVPAERSGWLPDRRADAGQSRRHRARESLYWRRGRRAARSQDVSRAFRSSRQIRRVLGLDCSEIFSSRSFRRPLIIYLFTQFFFFKFSDFN